MSLGYETFEDGRDFLQEGLTGTVKKYTTEQISFPCYVLVQGEDTKIEMIKIQVLQKMFTRDAIYDEDTAKLKINIYFNEGSKTLRLGQISPNQVKPFLNLFEDNLANIDGYYDKDTKLEGDFLYVLAE